MPIVVAPPIFDNCTASTMSLEEPECDMAIVTLCLSKCEAIIACTYNGGAHKSTALPVNTL